MKYIDPSGHDLNDVHGNDIEDTDQLLWTAGMLSAYGYTVDINLGDYVTDEYMFVNGLRTLESKGEIEEGFVDQYIEDEKEWVVRPTENGGYEIVEQPTIGPGGYWQFDVTCILAIGFRAGVVIDGNGTHWYIGAGVGYQVGGGVYTSPDPLITGMNTDLTVSYGPISKTWSYNGYTDEWSDSYGPTTINSINELNSGHFSVGISATSVYIIE